MSTRLLTLYLDISAGQLVTSPSQGTPRALPAFYQGDVIPVRGYLLEDNPTGGMTSPYSYIADADLSLKIGLVTPHPTTPVAHATTTLTYDAGGYYDGELTLGSGITSLLAAAASTTCSLEIEINDAATGQIRTVVQQSVTVRAQGIAAGSPPTDPPGDYYPSAGQIAAMYLHRSGGAGESFVLTSPDGTKQVQIYLGDDGEMHYDPIT